MHKNCGFKAFLKLLGLFKHQTNILDGTNVLDCACAKSWGYVHQGVLCTAKKGGFWAVHNTPCPSDHLRHKRFWGSRLRTAALFIAAPSVIMANTCFPRSWRSVNRLSIYTCDSWVPATNLATMSILTRRWILSHCSLTKWTVMAMASSWRVEPLKMTE